MSNRIQMPPTLPKTITTPDKNSLKAQSQDMPKSGAMGGLDIDKLGLSDDAKGKVLWAKSQFELNYQVLKSVNSANGVQTSEATFSFKASMEFLQKVSGEPATDRQNVDSTQETATTEEQDILAELMGYFSPEKTAQRILDVATSFFGLSEVGRESGNTKEARRTFADFIGSAIEEGFNQAASILGAIPDEVSAGVNKTHSLVFEGLKDFVMNGLAPEKTIPGGVFEKIAAYRAEAVEMSETIRTSTSATYNAKGKTT